MKYSIALITKKYRGMERNLMTSDFYNSKKKESYDNLLETYFSYIEECEIQPNPSLEKIIAYCKKFIEHGISCEIIVYDFEPINDVIGYSLELLGIDIVHDLCESLISDEVNPKIVHLLNENGLCRTMDDVERIIPYQNHGNVKWDSCYVYKINFIEFQESDEETFQNDIENQIEYILSKEETCVIDYFPERIADFSKFSKIEEFLLRKENKKKYTEKILSILLKLMPYFDINILIPETSKNCFRKYEGIFEYEKMDIGRVYQILEKLIINDETIMVLIKSLNIVLQIQLYNTAVYFEEYQQIPLLEKVIASEGLFFWKAE